ncbi:MAG: ABC transporter ATP-binding protein, partial [Methylococcales bacterium]|nr:ABC transporter ATP-binding protein [Methylococcales bacterium]
MLAINTNRLHKKFGDKVAVSDLTLQVNVGEVFGFLGPNGAGKTTSVKMLLGLISPTSGEGIILDKPLGDRVTRGDVGYLPEHFRFHDWLTASEFLHLHGQLYGMSKAKRNATIPDLLELVGLKGQENVQVGTYSKGMTQRIGLAQAIMNDPKIVFLDEPTSGLDPIGRRLVRDIIMGLREQGVTVFLNSHLLSEVELTCDRVAFIRQGQVVESMTIAALSKQQLLVTVRVGQPTPELIASLAQFGQVSSDVGQGKIAVAMTGGEEKVPALARHLIEQGHNIYELSPSRLTLEDRFIKIMES